MFHFKNKRGQTFVEYILIAVFIGMVLAVSSVNLFEGTQINFYYGLLPTNKQRVDLPPAPDGTRLAGFDKPNAVIEGPINVHLGDTVQYKSNSTDADGRIVRTNWGGNTKNYTFDQEGTYTVELTVWDNDGLSSTTQLEVVVGNKAPIANITISPDSTILWKDSFTIKGSNSYDPDGDRILDFEWKLNGIAVDWAYDTNTTKLDVGTHTVQLRVMDDFGKWSNWATKTLTVKPNAKPVAVILMSPDTNITDITNITWDYSRNTDPDGDSIVASEWQNKLSKYPVGTHTIKLRVKDQWGAWSDWVSKTFTVKASNRPPVAVISMSPTSEIDPTISITWGYGSSYDPDGDAIVNAEWQNKLSKYPAGTHTIKLRVQDSKGAWSPWVSKTFTVKTFLEVVKDFDYTGNYQTWTVPYDGTYKLEVWGAQGGYISNSATEGGKGGYTSGEINLNAGQVIYIYVGGRGGRAPAGNDIDNYDRYNYNGGWNGGGAGSGSRGPGGGGASDIRVSTSINDRVIVAGGGGGGWAYNQYNHGGQNYSPFLTYSSTGESGDRSRHSSSWPNDEAGGGGGYKGGRVIHGDDPSSSYGGSNYYSNLSNPISQSGVRSGHGYARITRTGGVGSPLATFYYNGSYSTWIAPQTATYKLEVWGAQGGASSGAGGKGGYSSGLISLNVGDKLYVYVGGQGEDRISGTSRGGFNGGGNGYWAGGGGGASDIRTAVGNLYSRIIVAGGGGGAYSSTMPGGNGGGNEGQSVNSSRGGTQTAGGSYGGQFGEGGHSTGPNAGGGGGGYFGGGSNEGQVWTNTAGSGGSGYVGGVQAGSTQSGVRTGSGMAKISIIN